MVITTHRKGQFYNINLNKASSSSLHGLVESPVLAANTVTSPTIFFMVFLRPVYRTGGVCRLEVECESLPSFANIFSIYLYILYFLHVKGQLPNSFSIFSFLHLPVQVQPLTTLRYFISAARILLRSGLLNIHVSLPCKGTGTSLALHRFKFAFFLVFSCSVFETIPQML